MCIDIGHLNKVSRRTGADFKMKMVISPHLIRESSDFDEVWARMRTGPREESRDEKSNL